MFPNHACSASPLQFGHLKQSFRHPLRLPLLVSDRIRPLCGLFYYTSVTGRQLLELLSAGWSAGGGRYRKIWEQFRCWMKLRGGVKEDWRVKGNTPSVTPLSPSPSLALLCISWLHFEGSRVEVSRTL
ncbi:hypothetical protein ATANTOWER_021886 [Ataeniobius toweri]|uniref:Uncharacterized protein n=1 Tax=Ataeniobius toweri TaxID=208326 RepID=A0ABU7BK08_9TELE|nr:hypothetical protein [Ataeniobius toweri]